MTTRYSGPASLLLIGVLFGLSGVIAKYLSAYLGPYQVVEYRFAVAFLLVLGLLIVTKQKLSFTGINPKTLAWFAVTFPISVIFFTLAIFNTTVSMAVFSFYISTLVTSFVVGHIKFGEKITTSKRIALVFILLAVIAFTNPFSDFKIQLGFIFGLMSGIFQTAASTFQKIVGNSTNRISLLIIQTFVGVIAAIVAIMLQGGSYLPSLPSTAIWITLAFGAMFLSISYLFLVGFKTTNLNVGSILVSTELFFGPFFALLFLGERLSGLELVGGVFVAAAVLLANK